MRKTPLILGLFFVGFFSLYTVSLAVYPKRFAAPGFFGTDDMQDTFEGRPTWAIRVKHPLFLLTAPLYRVGGVLYSGFSGHLAHNLRMSFPMAILGAAAVCLAYLVFLCNMPAREPAVLFALLYGVSGNMWFFSSLPETYVLTALCTNLALWMMWRASPEFTHREIYAAAGANVLACFAAPQQALLAVVPGMRWLLDAGLSKGPLAKTARYGGVLLAAFVVPYEILMKLTGSGWKFGTTYVAGFSNIHNLAHAGWAALVAANFLLYPVVSPCVHPRYYRDPAFSILTVLPASWMVLAACYVVFAASCVPGIQDSPAAGRKWALPLAVFLAVYLLFFLYFNPIESYLYSLPALLPWLLLLHTGLVGRCKGVYRLALYVLVAAVAVNSYNFRMFLHSLK